MKKTTVMLIVLVLAAASYRLNAQVSSDRLLRTGDEPQNWLTYSGTVMSQRYSALAQVTPDNVRNLELRWVFQAQSLEKFEATPLVVNGVLYTVQAPNDIVALDAATGRVFWVYSYAPSTLSRPCRLPALPTWKWPRGLSRPMRVAMPTRSGSIKPTSPLAASN